MHFGSIVCRVPNGLSDTVTRDFPQVMEHNHLIDEEILHDALQASRQMRVFLSGTWEDFREERETLMRDVVLEMQVLTDPVLHRQAARR